MSPVPPKKIRHLETIWIPMSDGVRLAGRLWLPEDAEQHPVPAILEYIPYRRRDGTREGDELTHPYVAGHGYACLRLDIRGSGDSEGVIHDEYSKQEQDDAVEAIAWLAAQTWCDGKVG
ncbi:MAG TPA: CocE/NonD family hydrolase, partial [Dongiaceae bacterium]